MSASIYSCTQEPTYSPLEHDENGSASPATLKSDSSNYGDSDTEDSEPVPSRIGRKTPGPCLTANNQKRRPSLHQQKSYVRMRDGNYTDYDCATKFHPTDQGGQVTRYSYANCLLLRPLPLPLCSSQTSVRASLARDQVRTAADAPRESSSHSDGLVMHSVDDGYDADGMFATSTLVKHLEHGAEEVTARQLSDRMLSEAAAMRSIVQGS